MSILIDGLNQIGEKELADTFYPGFEPLRDSDFYEHMNWNKVSKNVKSQIEVIGAMIGDRLWALNGKLATLLYQADSRRTIRSTRAADRADSELKCSWPPPCHLCR
ncbi:MAG: hypothetical protein ACKO0N_14610 [Planctomycetota bacterium]